MSIWLESAYTYWRPKRDTDRNASRPTTDTIPMMRLQGNVSTTTSTGEAPSSVPRLPIWFRRRHPRTPGNTSRSSKRMPAAVSAMVSQKRVKVPAVASHGG